MAGFNLRDDLSLSKKSDSRDGLLRLSTGRISLFHYHYYWNYDEFLVWITEIIKIKNRYSYGRL